MSRKEKLLNRLKGYPKDFSWEEATSLLKRYGCERYDNKGGSHQIFIHVDSNRKLHITRPHPINVLKKYQIESILDFLTDLGLIE